MKTAGIIAEINPLHNGHKYLMDYARKVLKADRIVVVLGGNFTQRGTASLLNYYDRASMAASAGADLVLLMPQAASCGSAETFARAGVGILNATGIVDTLVFGCEEKTKSYFDKIGRLLADEPAGFKDDLLKYMREGINYPAARAMAVARQFPEEMEEEILSFLYQPNNILGIEYVKAILQSNSGMEYTPVTRVGAGYHSRDLAEAQMNRENISRNLMQNERPSVQDVINLLPSHTAEILSETVEMSSDSKHSQTGSGKKYNVSGNQILYPSSTSIRELIRYTSRPVYQNGLQHVNKLFREYGSALARKLVEMMPAEAAAMLLECIQQNSLVFTEDFDLLMHEHLLINDSYEKFTDCSSDMSNRILSLRNEYVSFTSFADKVKTKNLTRARITRVMCNILLDITDLDEDALKDTGYAPYLHILSIRGEGKNMLHEIRQNLKNSQESEDPSVISPVMFFQINELRDSRGNYISSLSASQRQLLNTDLRSADMYRIVQTSKVRAPLPSEYTRKAGNV